MRWSIAEAIAYSRGGAQIGHSARDYRLSDTNVPIAERRNECVARIVRLGGHVIAPSREPIERWSTRVAAFI